MFRWHVVFAVFARNVKQYFSGPLGYLFIVVFVTVCSLVTFNPQFFADNLANLDQLSRSLPFLLLFFIPAITMSVWADEKRQGTDSILFTLPASDLDILLGKYFAVVAVYTIALFFSLFQLINLANVGTPDWGVIAATYIGYWLAGLALLAIGMFASSLTRSATIAFVVGALLCAIPVLIGHYFSGVIGLERLGFDWNLRDFTTGLIPLSGVVYFLGLAVFMLYLNLVVISRRHWSRGQQFTHAPHYLMRVLSLAVGLAALGFLSTTAVSNLWARADLTSEKLYVLDQTTTDTLKKIKDADRVVTIQAFISRDVPRKYVNAKNQLVSLLRQFSHQGGNNIVVRTIDVAPSSDEASEARVAGIDPKFDRSEVAGRVVEQDVYLGAKITSSLGEVIIPSIDGDTSIEYELTRALAYTIDKGHQITVGIVDTDTYFGGPLIEGRRVPWAYESTMAELKKQFKIKHYTQTEFAAILDEAPQTAESTVASTAESSDTSPPKPTQSYPDVLLVADPSSLDQSAMATLVKYIQLGRPTVILADPLPFQLTYQHPQMVGVINAPRQPRLSSRSPYQHILSSSPAPKADHGTAASLLRAIGVEWNSGTAVWNLDNPHPNFKGVWPEYIAGELRELYGPRDKALVFVRDRANHVAFNHESVISSGLKELLFIYPGSVHKSDDSPFDFHPLVSIGTDSGTTPWEHLTFTPKQQTPVMNRRTGEIKVEERAAPNQFTADDLVLINPKPLTTLDEENHVVAAHVTGKGNGENSINVIFITDMDFVSDVAYLQQDGLESRVDNLALLTNAIEVLSGNPSFVNLRNRRISPRTLVRLEQYFEIFRRERAEKQQQAESDMQQELTEERTRLNLAAQEIQSDESLSVIEKLQRTSQEASDARRRFDMRKRKLEKELSQTIDRLQTEEQKAISKVENRTRYLAVLTAPIPALALGILVLTLRYYNEQKNIAPQRKSS